MGKFRMLLVMLVTSIVSLHAEDFTLTGTVVDGAGSPLEGVAVKLLNRGITATTNSSGDYTIKGQTVAAVSAVSSASMVNLVSVFPQPVAVNDYRVRKCPGFSLLTSRTTSRKCCIYRQGGRC